MSSALYRKYRPVSFEGIIGQEHITGTLQNQIKSGRIGHAYLFCGSRGVGKTSLARIFSRAINCENSGRAPCGTCKTCLAGAGASLDITEIDAASNNGVDDARDLREKIKYPPVSGKYKVYIIDEVHMLTGSAFNALLKTLEEPPAHAVFILATTEPHKLPATILSRCLRFDFRLVSMQRIYTLLSVIYSAEGKDFEEDALRAVAAAAEGSVRDALSLADMCLNLSDGILKASDAAAVLGSGGEEIITLLDRINAGDVKNALIVLSGLAAAGKSMGFVSKELASYARDLMVAKTSPQILETTNEQLDRLVSTAAGFSLSGLAALVWLFSETESALRYSVSPRIAMEAAIIRAVKLYSPDIAAIDERILRLERAMATQGGGVMPAISLPLRAATPISNHIGDAVNISGSNVIGNAGSNIGKPGGINLTEGRIAPAVTEQRKTNEEQLIPAVKTAPVKTLSAAQLWGRIITFFRKNSTPAFLQVIGRQNPEKLRLEDGILTIFAARDNFLPLAGAEIQEELRRALLNEGQNVRIAVEKDSGDVDMEKEIASFTEEFGKNKVNIQQ